MITVKARTMQVFNMKIIFFIIPLIVGISSILNIYGQQEQEEKYLNGENLDKAKITYYDNNVKCEVMKLEEKISQFIDCSGWVLTYEVQYAIAGYKAQQAQATKDLFEKAQQDQALEDLNESSRK